MPGTRQLLRAGQPGRAGADHRNFFAGFFCGRLRHDPALLPAFVGDGVFDGFDTHRVVVYIERACRLARRRTDAAGEFGKIVGRMQRRQRCAPVLLVDQVVPVGNDVVDRATAHAERRAAVHAARPLYRRLLIGQVPHELAVMLLARLRGFARLLQPLELHEPGDLAHSIQPLIQNRSPQTKRAKECNAVFLCVPCAQRVTPRACRPWRRDRRARAGTRAGIS